MHKTNRIAILLAAYNGERYIEEQLKSLLAQSCSDWELFIHDDGSRDKTPEIIAAYGREYPDRIHVLPGAPSGSAKENFFFLMRQVQAPYLMFCDQDDVWLPEKVEETLSRMKALEKQMEPGVPLLVFSDLSVVDGGLRLIAERMSVYQKLDPERVRPENLVVQNVVTGCTVMINQPLAELALKPENVDDVIMHDWWCALIAACMGKISFVDSSLTLYRQHENNSVGAKSFRLSSCFSTMLNVDEIRSSMDKKRRQASVFANTYDFPEKPLFEEFVHLKGKNLFLKLWFYSRRRVWMCGWQRNLGLLILG